MLDEFEMSESFQQNRSTSGESMLSAAATPVRRTAELASQEERERRLLALSSSALLTFFARELWSVKIRREYAPTLPGLGIAFDPNWSALATLCCPSDLEPVALGLSTNWIGCSCLPSVPTPTASQFACKDVPRMLARRERCKEKHNNGNGFGLTFGQWFAMKCFTPVASDYKGSTGKGSRRNTLSEQLAMNCGPNDGTTVYPHPEFVEAVMKFPITWSECADSATQSTRMSRTGSAND
jgi:hypothetical protein